MKYDSKKLIILKEWIKLVGSKKTLIKNRMGFAKGVYDNAEAMDTWDEMEQEVKDAKERKITKSVVQNNEAKELQEHQNEKDRLLKSISKERYIELRSRIIHRLTTNKELEFASNNINFNSGFGKVILETEMAKELRDHG